MSTPYCNVALPVPLRTTFTYAVPEALRGQVLPGSRVLAPFRKKSLVGVVVEMVETPPEGTKIREISKVLDLLPALTPKLIELGHWIAGYYLAPIGEVFRAMLPPVTDLSLRREMVLTEAGRSLVGDLQVGRSADRPFGAASGFPAQTQGEEGHALLGSFGETRHCARRFAAAATARLSGNSREYAGPEAQDATNRGVERTAKLFRATWREGRASAPAADDGARAAAAWPSC